MVIYSCTLGEFNTHVFAMLALFLAFGLRLATFAIYGCPEDPCHEDVPVQDPEAEDPDQQEPGKRSSLIVLKQLGGEGGPGLLDHLDGLLLAGLVHHQPCGDLWVRSQLQRGPAEHHHGSPECTLWTRICSQRFDSLMFCLAQCRAMPNLGWLRTWLPAAARARFGGAVQLSSVTAVSQTWDV